MMASRCDSSGRPHAIALAVALIVAATVMPSCKSVLPPQEPGEDPTEASAPIPAWTAKPSPYETSAFAGEKLSKGGGHAHHKMGHAAKPKAEAKPEPEPEPEPEPKPKHDMSDMKAGGQ